VPDRLLREALERLAVEAATRFSSLVAAGEEIPFDVAEDSGEDALFYRYVPLTARFVAEREEEIRSLPAFGPARDAVAETGVAAPYLESRGVAVAVDPAQRAERMLIAFIAELWDGCGEFALDRRRLGLALDRLHAQSRDLDEVEMLIAPIVGLRMPLAALSLPSGVSIVRADSIDAPIEAMRSEGMNREPWEPQFLILVEQGEGPEGTVEAMAQLRDLISVLRLFKRGGVGLGPYAFAPAGHGEWRRIATGAPAPRPGGFRLNDTEAEELRGFARRLEALPDPDGALRWAISRFEMGCERPSPLEGLSDHLLALRALLGDDEAVERELHLRAAALAGDEGDREEAKQLLRDALQLERRLMSASEAERVIGTADESLAVAAWLEVTVRSILRDAALDELGTDLRQATEGALISAGLEAAEEAADHRGDSAEWELPGEQADAPDTPGREAEGPALHPDTPGREAEGPALHPGTPGREAEGPALHPGTPGREAEDVPGPDQQIRVTAWTDIEVREGNPEAEGEEKGEMINRDWLSEVSRDATLEWPAADDRRPPREREPIDTPRVRHLFPVPEDADWEVSELEYARRTRVG
jgi:hypothetical protein